MTEENYQYRTSQTMLRNQFEGEGTFQIPVVPKSEFTEEDFRDLLLIGFDRARPDDEKNRDRMVHFFLYDYKFERVWKDAEKDRERLKNYRAVLSPDFSMYQEMNPTMQLFNTFRNRWCGAYWADKGLRVIPTVSWGNENTFEFCFLGIPKGSTVAVSTYMVSEHDNRCDQKDFFMKGYREMLRRIEPERIICYNTPFPEMDGHIVFVDYELSSWKYQEKEYRPSPYVKYITRELPLPENSGIIIKRGYLISTDKGMGSALAHNGSRIPTNLMIWLLLVPPIPFSEFLFRTEKAAIGFRLSMAMMAGQQHFGTKQNIIRINSIRIPMTTSLWRMTHILMHRIGITHRKSIIRGLFQNSKRGRRKII